MSQLRVRLKDVAKRIQYGYTASASDDESIGPKFLRITDIVPDQIDWLNVPFCPIEENLFDKYALHSGDIVIARTGNTTGYAKLIREEQRAIFASYLIRVQLDERKADPGFVGRLVESNAYKQFVNSQKGGAAQGNANAQVLTLFEFILPPLQIQHKIASILSAYDDLIENNRRRMALLEESARLLYREWFVCLRFPGHARTRITDGVPKGWCLTTLGEHLVLNYGKALKAEDRVDGDIPVYGSSGIVGTHDKALSEGPGIIVGRKGNVGSVYWSPTAFYAIDTVYFIAPDKSDLYLFHAVKHMHFINTDVAVPGLNRDMAYSRPLLLPSKTIQQNFLKVVSPVYEQIIKLDQLNQRLRTARDLLLPRLMSGKIAP